MFTKEQLSIAYAAFNGEVSVIKTAKPRPSEKTFRNNRYSIYNMGHQACATGRRAFYATPDSSR